MNYFNDNHFKDKFQVTKTLQFKLIPILGTKYALKEDNIIQISKQQKRELNKIKEYADELHKLFVENILSNFSFTQEEIDDLYNNFNEKELCKRISNLFTSSLLYKKLLGKQLITELLPSTFTSEEELELFSHFEKFTTYLVPYNTNKKELYKPNGILTKNIVSNIKNVIMQNLCYKYDLNKYLSQAGINLYNELNKESEFEPLKDLFSINNNSSIENDLTRVMFNFPNFLSGWDINNERTNGGFILEKDGNYFLAVVKDKSIFKNLKEDNKGNNYNKLVYKFIPGASKYFSKNITETNSPAEIIEIKNKKEWNLIELQTYIDYIKNEFIPNYPSLNDENGNPYFNFKFKEKYDSINDFYADIDKQSISMKFQKVSEEIINKYVTAGKLYLFQIYTKDFGQGKGRDSLNTIYLKKLFSQENMNNPKIKLNGNAKIFYRMPTQKEGTKIHSGTKIKNKKPINGKEYSQFDYDIIPNRRFTREQINLNLSLTFNVDSPKDTLYCDFDDYVKYNYENVLTITRGQDFPFSFVLYNGKGKIIEKSILTKTDVSDFIYETCKYINKFSPIIVMEDFNLYIKNDTGMISIKKYKEFQNKLISKLQYYISKDLDNYPIQLCHKITSEKFVQNGIVFRTNKHLTKNYKEDSKYLFEKIINIIEKEQTLW